jgi:hypothetical protein
MRGRDGSGQPAVEIVPGDHLRVYLYTCCAHGRQCMHPGSEFTELQSTKPIAKQLCINLSRRRQTGESILAGDFGIEICL